LNVQLIGLCSVDQSTDDHSKHDEEIEESVGNEHWTSKVLNGCRKQHDLGCNIAELNDGYTYCYLNEGYTSLDTG
jgi:hypothetical protein